MSFADYSDMYDLPHPVFAGHPRMSMHDRAAQFSPFAALTGYDSLIREEGRLTGKFVPPDEEKREELLAKLNFLAQSREEEPPVTVTYFVPDERKEGGSLETVIGTVKKIDNTEGSMTLWEGMVIPFDRISDIEGAMFPKE